MQPNSLQNRCCCQTMPPMPLYVLNDWLSCCYEGAHLPKTIPQLYPKCTPFFLLALLSTNGGARFLGGHCLLSGTLQPVPRVRYVPFDRSPIPKQPFAYTQTTDRLYSNANAFQNEGQGWGTAGVGFDKHCPLITI